MTRIKNPTNKAGWLFLASLTLMIAAICQSATAAEKSIAFFYGAKPSVNTLSQFDRIVLESDNIQPDELTALKQHGNATYAYLSVGEVGPQRPWSHLIKDTWTLGRNTAWNSTVMDLTSTQWQRFVLQRVDALVAKGYNGLFLDTMDSYHLHTPDNQSKAAQQDALANLIYRINRRHPQLSLISNRGFEIIDKIANYLDAVAAESLFARWDNEAGAYTDVPEADRQWLSNTLAAVKNKHGLDVISIDYVSPADRDKAREVARKISALGFTPWVGNPTLDYLGISTLEVIPREIIMLYDSRINGAIENAEVHTLLAMPLEYMGYVPVYHNIADTGLPQGTLNGHYAGAVMWNRNNALDQAGYDNWINTQLDNGFPLVMFGSIGTELSKSIADKMGVELVSHVDSSSLQPIKSDNLIGFEAQPPVRIEQAAVPLAVTSPTTTSHLRYQDKNGLEIDTVISGPWGGAAIYPTIRDVGVDHLRDWVVDPFNFMKTALKLTDVPMPDVTSENGNRLWFSQIDGDALPSWAEMPGRQLGSELIRDKILKRYKLPHTVSIVEAEFNNLAIRDRLEQTARDIFALDYVEIATHTFSHPFHWQALNAGDESGENNLRVPGYGFSLDREIGGSAKFIDTVLAPPGKKTEVMLWTGDAIPRADAIATAAKYGLINLNGGFTTISKADPTVAAIAPNVRIVDGWTQIYAPIMNENIYTNEWLGPFDGFRRVIETFDMTEYPRRIKPIDVYYHFYAGTKKAALRSLEEIYDWSLQQEIVPVLSSYYIVKVPDYRTAGVARYLDGRWKVSGLGNIKSLRVLDKNSWPDLASSGGSLIGAKETHDATYIHTNGANNITFRMQSTRPQTPHLVSANAKVTSWQRRSDNSISLRLEGALPVVFELNGDRTYCDIKARGNTVRGKLTPEGNTRFNFPQKDTGDAVIDCKT